MKMSTQTISRTLKCVELEAAVRNAVELMGATLSRLAEAVSLEDQRRPELQVLEDGVKLVASQAARLSASYLQDEPVRSLEGLDPKYRQPDEQLLQRVKARYLERQVLTSLLAHMQDEVKELRRWLATFEKGDKTLVDLERAEREKLVLQVQRMEEEIMAHKEYSALVHRDLTRNASEFRRFISRLEHALSTLEDNFEDLEERTKDWANYCTYEIFLKECRRIFDEAVAGMGCAATTTIRRSAALQKAVRDAMNVAVVTLLLHLHGRVMGTDVCGPEQEVVDVEARIGDLQRKILQHHEQVKLQADSLRLSLIDINKRNDLLKEKLQACQLQNKQLQETIDVCEKRGLLGDAPSDDTV